jgi:hypothetical protein
MSLSTQSWARGYDYVMASEDQVQIGAQQLIESLLPEMTEGLGNKIGAANLAPELRLSSVDSIQVIPHLSLGLNERTYEVNFSLLDGQARAFKSSLLMNVVVAQFRDTTEPQQKILADLKTMTCTGTFSQLMQVQITDVEGHELYRKEHHCFASKLPL